MRICLLLLFLIGNSIAGELEIGYKVLPEKGEISRRADVIFACSLSSSKNKRNYTLSIRKLSNRAVMTISFRGTGVRVEQPLKEGQTLKEAFLKKVDVLSGDTISTREIQFENNLLLIRNLDPNYVYKISYTIATNDKIQTLKLIAPKVETFESQEQVEEGKSLIFSVPIFFSPGSWKLDSKSQFVLDNVKSLLNFCSVTVVGYADNTAIKKSSASSNKELAKRRALAVKSYLSGR